MHAAADTAGTAGSAGSAGSVLEAKRQVTVDAIRKAACDLLLREGLDITMDEIAEAAGVSRRTLFRHFGSRERLLASAFEAGMHRYGERLSSLEGDWQVALRRLCRTVHRVQAGYGPGYWELLHRQDLPAELEAVERKRDRARRAAMREQAKELHHRAGGRGDPSAELVTTVAAHLSARFTAAVVHDAGGTWETASDLAYQAIAAVLDHP